MRLPARLLSFGLLLSALAGAAFLLLPPPKAAQQNFDHVGNDLCIVAPATPFDPASGRDRLAPRPVPAEARCPVCGMYPARYPRWAAQTVFRDGAAHFFDSPADLFAFLQKVDRHDRRYTASDVAQSFVSDFDTGRWVEARQAFFVQGSSAFGPMRDADLPAFADRAAAETLARSRGGRVLAFAEVTPELVQSLSRNLHHRH
jgi:nitrous oxide reductase accessory protein NosL